MAALRVRVVVDTVQLRCWAAKHRDLGHESVATVLTVAAEHYEHAAPSEGEEPSAPVYPAGLDSAELWQWANWHIDRGPVGVSHTLFGAANRAGIGS